ADASLRQDVARGREPGGVASLRESASLRCRATPDACDFNAFLTPECHARARMGRAHAAGAEDRESQGTPGPSQGFEPIRTMVGALKVGSESTIGLSLSQSPPGFSFFTPPVMSNWSYCPPPFPIRSECSQSEPNSSSG